MISVMRIHASASATLLGALVPDLALVGDAGAGDDLVVEVERRARPPRRSAGRAGSRGSWRRAARRGRPSRWRGCAARSTFTPPSTTVSPALVSSQLPPVSAARSTITEPGAIAATASAVISVGAGRPGIGAVVMITSCAGGVLGQRLAHLLVLLVGERARVAALGLGVGDEVELERPAAEDWICSQAARRMSKPVTTRRGASPWRSPAARRRRRRAPAPWPGGPCRRPWSSSGRSGRTRARRAAPPRSRRRSPARRARPSPGRG